MVTAQELHPAVTAQELHPVLRCSVPVVSIFGAGSGSASRWGAGEATLVPPLSSWTTSISLCLTFLGYKIKRLTVPRSQSCVQDTVDTTQRWMRQVRPLGLIPALVPEVQGEHGRLTKHSFSPQNESRASRTGPSTSPRLSDLSKVLEGPCLLPRPSTYRMSPYS